MQLPFNTNGENTEPTTDNQSNYLKELNDVQRAAVECLDGPMMIIAGPGSGKTRVLTYRIAHLINNGVRPWQILSLTFTNKAAQEMKKRISKIVGEEAAQSLWMGTFHSIFARILRIEADKLGYPTNFTIYDTEDAKSLIKNILKERNLNVELYKPNLVYSRISSAKNKLLTPAAYLANNEIMASDFKAKRPQLGKIYKIYAQRCKQAGAMDFDDLLVNTYFLFNQHPEILGKYQQKYRHLLIDEFQDTNTAQYAIVQKLATQHRNICIVGDDAQSIYGFRGATIANILNFEKDYKDLKVFKLEQNYRSTQKIVNIANDVIACNQNQLDKTIWTDNDSGQKVNLIQAPTDKDEAKMIAESIVITKLRSHFKHSEFAILYRTNAQSRAMEEALRKKNIPYKIYGGLSFYQRKEIKDLMAYLRLTTNHHDEEALRRVINYPKRGIGKTTIDKLAKIAMEHEVPLWRVMVNVGQFSLSARVKKAIKGFANSIMHFAKEAEKLDAYELAKYIGRMTNLVQSLHNDKSVEGINRYENLQELFNSIKEFVDVKKETVPTDPSEKIDASLGAYLQEVSLLTDINDKEDSDNQVKLMTIHSAKGLEFPCVYVVGLEENLFPSKRSTTSITGVEEERRLFYVAVTRAEKSLTLSYAKNRYQFGTVQSCEPSRFVSEINPSHLQIVGTSLKSGSSDFRRKTDTYQSFKESVRNNAKMIKSQRPTKPIDPKLLANFKVSPASDIKEGAKVIHQRFGLGLIEKVDGFGAKKVASINFGKLGNKRIMLKFAKLMVIG